MSSKKAIVEKIGLLRNKLYAHTDRDVDNLSIEITFSEVNELIIIIEKVIRGIYNHSFESDISATTPIFEREKFDLLKILAKEKSDRIEMIRNWDKFT